MFPLWTIINHYIPIINHYIPGINHYIPIVSYSIPIVNHYISMINQQIPIDSTSSLSHGYGNSMKLPFGVTLWCQLLHSYGKSSSLIGKPM